MKAQLVRWGNSLAVRIPRAIVRQAGIHEGDNLNVSFRAGTIVIEQAQPKLTLRKLLADIQPETLHGEQEWDKATGSEVW